MTPSDDRPPGAPLPAESDPWAPLRRYTTARVGLGRAGRSLPTRAHLDFQLAHALARDAVAAPFDSGALAAELREAGFDALNVRSAAPDRRGYLLRPDLGRRLAAESRERLAEVAASWGGADAVFVAADGLSALAVQRHALPLLRLVVPPLRGDGWTLAPVVVAELSRVALGDEIGFRLGAKLVAMLIGERPGLTSPDSLGVYLTYDPRPGRKDADRNCISNIRPEGLSYEAAAHKLRFLMGEARRRRLTGIELKDDAPPLGLTRPAEHPIHRAPREPSA